ncbi:MAG TPA: DUF3109 family protein [Candidatus Ozemobacteraceae bacterium]|nr:DUF3109 family protein [Candidatus Ozemobacteraceae bacterium]
MRQIGQVVIADDVWETRFACDLMACGGACCAIGDRGTPIDADEAATLARAFPLVRHRLSKASVRFLEAGITETHKGRLYIREVSHNAPCPFAIRGDQNMLLCSIHAHCLEERLPVLEWKPLWCTLFPFVVTQSGDQWLVNQYIAPHCRTRQDAPLLLDWGAPLLEKLFGDAWVANLNTELTREFGADRVRPA